MLDTIKVRIPLTRAQQQRIHTEVTKADRHTWVVCNQATGEIMAWKFQGSLDADGESYHRELRFHYPPIYEPESKLTIEFSIPKFWQGHNIMLLYNWVHALERLRELIIEQFNLKGNQYLTLPKTEDWEVYRVDTCYAYKFPSQDSAQAYLDSLKRHKFPRKQPQIYPTSMFFGEGTYSFKIYLKLPEFMAHDHKELLKQEVRLEYLDHLINMAEGVFRVEACFRRKYLKRHGINTVGDLLKTHTEVIFDKDLKESEGFSPLKAMTTITTWNIMESQGVDELNPSKLPIKESPLRDGQYLYAPKMVAAFNGEEYHHAGGGFKYLSRDVTVHLLKTLLHRFLGGNQGMQVADRVKQSLMNTYQQAKAARLLGFWLHVQRFGSEDAKTAIGKTVYYRNKSDLKKAGVALVESEDSLITVDPDFFSKFKLDIPSEFVVNKFDNHRDGDNILNLPIQEVGQ